MTIILLSCLQSTIFLYSHPSQLAFEQIHTELSMEPQTTAKARSEFLGGDSEGKPV
jgi:hypothetical protein